MSILTLFSSCNECMYIIIYMSVECFSCYIQHVHSWKVWLKPHIYQVLIPRVIVKRTYIGSFCQVEVHSHRHSLLLSEQGLCLCVNEKSLTISVTIWWYDGRKGCWCSLNNRKHKKVFSLSLINVPVTRISRELFHPMTSLTDSIETFR